MAKPFGLYSNHINLTLGERMNLIERESCKIYKSKINDLNDEILRLKKEFYGSDYEDGDSQYGKKKKADPYEEFFD